MSIIPIRLPRCPMVPARFTRLKCWHRCRYWLAAEKRCTVEVREKEEQMQSARKEMVG